MRAANAKDDLAELYDMDAEGAEGDEMDGDMAGGEMWINFVY